MIRWACFTLGYITGVIITLWVKEGKNEKQELLKDNQ
jgi:hypothetical protein